MPSTNNATVFALKLCRHYLYGVHCKIFTNHQILKYFFTRKELNMRQRRSLELVKDYDCEILFHPRKANKVVDTLSRNSCAILTSLMEIIPILRREIQEFGIEYLIG